MERWLVTAAVLFAVVSVGFAQCDQCQSNVLEIEDTLMSNATEQDVLKFLTDICDQLPEKLKAECLQQVAKLAPQINQTLDSITTKYSPFAICGMLDLCQMECCPTPYLPEQIHLSLTRDISEMTVMWTTLYKTPSPTVIYGLDENNLNMTVYASANTSNFGGWKGNIYSAVMTNLEAGRKYFYRVGDPTVAPHYWMKPAESQPRELSFVTRTQPMRDAVTKIGVIGDAGATDASMMTFLRLKEHADRGELSMLLHNGDIGYADGYATIWDQYLRKLESFAAFTPVMTSPGNHEGFFNFHPYKARFTMPWNQSASSDPLYYSFDYGNIHIVSLNSEGFMGLSAQNITKESDMYQWLEQDLVKASAQRDSVTPWIVVMLHRPLYCMENNADCNKDGVLLREGLEDLLQAHHVDLVIQAHRHNYQATWPVFQANATAKSYNSPTSPVYVLCGAAGNKEHLNGVSPSQDWARFALEEYGYGMITSNETALLWQFMLSETGRPADSFTITK